MKTKPTSNDKITQTSVKNNQKQSARLVLRMEHKSKKNEKKKHQHQNQNGSIQNGVVCVWFVCSRPVFSSCPLFVLLCDAAWSPPFWGGTVFLSLILGGGADSPFLSLSFGLWCLTSSFWWCILPRPSLGGAAISLSRVGGADLGSPMFLSFFGVMFLLSSFCAVLPLSSTLEWCCRSFYLS